MTKLALGILLAAAIATPAAAQNYPSRPITMIVPFAAGGPTDTVARVTAETMGRILGQNIIVENVAGAGGTTGSHRAVRSDPDGHTILLNHLGLATAVTLYRKLPFDPTADLSPVGVVSDASMVIIARPGYQAESLADLIKDVKARGQDMTFAHSGLGASSQLCGLLFMAAVDKKLTQVPFRGGGPVLQALLANQVDLGCEQATTAAPQLQSKSIKGYAVTSTQRFPALPDLPTVGEGGLPNMEISVWHGLFVPAKTPEFVVRTLSVALAKALQDPTLARRFIDISTVPTPEKATPHALAQTLKGDIGRWRPLIQAAGQFAD